MKQALLFESLSNNRVRCKLCAHRCLISDDHFGVCNVRLNKGGKLYTLVYGRLVSRHIDPIEKKPLYHFKPGSSSYSIATPGCNFRCQWCQNSEIAQMPREQEMISGYDTPVQALVAEIVSSNCESVAYTYTEPTIFFEYAYDIAKEVQKASVNNIYVTNGYMTSEMLNFIAPYLDAANVDLKAFQEKTYQRYMGASLQPVLDSLIQMKALGIWVEVTTLVISGINDHPDELREISKFIAGELGEDTPWHISRFFPHYKMMSLSPTPISTLKNAYEIGKEEGLSYVYIGNVSGESNTYCPQCGELLVRRNGYWIRDIKVIDGVCSTCKNIIPGIW